MGRVRYIMTYTYIDNNGKVSIPATRVRYIMAYNNKCTIDIMFQFPQCG